MDNLDKIKKLAVETIEHEIAAVGRLASFVDDDFARAVECILTSSGRVIITGIGKSAIIASKIVATLNSTGTPAIFMHAADAIHGDLGIIQHDDVVICISNSGSSPEIKVLVPLIKNIGGNKLIAMVGNRTSLLATSADHIIYTHVDSEACPHNLAPTSSTTAQLVMGDALAITLLNMRGFTQEDYARVHPGGALGKKMYLRVEDLMAKDLKPQVSPDTGITETIIAISSGMLGAAAVINTDGTLAGVITDGDLRRMLEKGRDISGIKARDIMTLKPKTVHADELAVEAFKMMEKYKITQLVVVDNRGAYCGMVHIHDIIREGIV